eukprot:scaffold11618_cov56-Isochrysis_galbana.AAC.1
MCTSWPVPQSNNRLSRCRSPSPTTNPSTAMTELDRAKACVLSHHPRASRAAANSSAEMRSRGVSAVRSSSTAFRTGGGQARRGTFAGIPSASSFG